MRTSTELVDWCVGAAAEFGDPSIPVCQLFFRWQRGVEHRTSDELVCGFVDGRLQLVIDGCDFVFPISVHSGDPEITDEGDVTYGATRITSGVYALTPSLNAVGILHAFIVLYDAPEPAPWDQRIVLP